MKTVFSTLKNRFAFCLVAVCLLVFTTGCGSGVSQEEYEQLESELAQLTTELAQVKEQLAQAQEEAATAQELFPEVQSLWESCEPKVRLGMLLIENIRDYQLWQQGKITQTEFFKLAGRVWAEMTTSLDQIGNQELTEKWGDAWFEPMESKDKNKLWAEAYELYLSELSEDLEALSEKLGE